MRTLSSGGATFSGTMKLPSWHTSSWWYPMGTSSIMCSTWIIDLRYGYYEVRFGGNAKVLQSYFAVAKIEIWLCMYSFGSK